MVTILILTLTTLTWAFSPFGTVFILAPTRIQSQSNPPGPQSHIMLGSPNCEAVHKK